MKDIIIKRTSKLYKGFELLSALPIFNSFVKEDYFYNKEGDREYYITSFNDICTFCRHVIFSLLTTGFYLLVLAFIVNFLFVQPIVYLLGASTISGGITWIFICLIALWYCILLSIQTIGSVGVSLIDMIPEKEETKDKGFIRSSFSLLSEKHNNICKRVKIED